MLFTQYFVSCVHVRCYFSPPLIFTLLATSISHFLTRRHVFLPTNSSPLFSITRSSSFSVIQVSVKIKNNAEKDTTLLLFFLSKSPGGHVKTLSCIWVAIPVDWVILHWYACGGDGRSLALSVYGHVITKLSRMCRLPHLLSYGAQRRALSSAKNHHFFAQLSHCFSNNSLYWGYQFHW